ncbi:RNA-directed DNA polymerase, eukaryota, Reverse transcriptase zinc-binding domain protein [Artemisia annua]|uniref:RNA-directed DNA polymerase, eukaryota, Reverse transcriptase zinc-binding domain protein n=1 Tax=Artemisia annua TaxID=35608 RepID=A0A2U1M1N5_ARTAN|nr:RNA-directed DNA polymerase, eukaryota, Reverse transcriptase zinc-binding domain protein [Artemisia annua]
MRCSEKNDDMVCGFCKLVPDSHSHLFFECDFPRKVSSRLKYLVRLDNAPDSWQNLIDFMASRPVRKSIWNILQRLLIGACVYYIWQERNLRIFQGRARSFDEVCCQIRDVVRGRAMRLRLKASIQVFNAANLWDFHVKHGCLEKDIMNIREYIGCLGNFVESWTIGALFTLGLGLIKVVMQ